MASQQLENTVRAFLAYIDACDDYMDTGDVLDWANALRAELPGAPPAPDHDDAPAALDTVTTRQAGPGAVPVHPDCYCGTVAAGAACAWCVTALGAVDVAYLGYRPCGRCAILARQLRPS